MDTLRIRGGRQRIYGVVATAEELRPLSNASVQILGTPGGQVTTDSSGRFSYTVKTVGAYLVRGTYKERGSATASVTVAPETEVEIALLLDATPAPGANALEMAYAEFRERLMRRGVLANALVTRSELMASGRDGVLSSLQTSRAVTLKGLRFSDVACVFIDGRPSPGTPANSIGAAEVEAVEVYSSTADRSGTLIQRWPRNMPCGETGLPRATPPRNMSGPSNRKAPSDIVQFIVIWLKH